MKRFTPSPPLQAVLQIIPAILATPIPTASPGPFDAGLGGDFVLTVMPPNLPPMPPRSTDPEEAAFYDALIVPLYTIAMQFQTHVTAAITAARARHPVITYDPNTGLMGPSPDQLALMQASNLRASNPNDPLLTAYDYWISQSYTPSQAWASALATQPPAATSA